MPSPYEVELVIKSWREVLLKSPPVERKLTDKKKRLILMISVVVQDFYTKKRPILGPVSCKDMPKLTQKMRNYRPKTSQLKGPKRCQKKINFLKSGQICRKDPD